MDAALRSLERALWLHDHDWLMSCWILYYTSWCQQQSKSPLCPPVKTTCEHVYIELHICQDFLPHSKTDFHISKTDLAGKLGRDTV